MPAILCIVDGLAPYAQDNTQDGVVVAGTYIFKYVDDPPSPYRKNK
jgi:hypothetical protein